MYDIDISMDSEGCICNIAIPYEYNSEMANFRYYDILTRIITTFSIQTNVRYAYVNSRNDTSSTLVRIIMFF